MSAQASAQSATGSPLGSYLTSWSHKAPDSAGEEMIVVNINYEVSSLSSRDLVCPYIFLGLLQKKAPDGFQAKASWMPELYAEFLL
jgi:hypothetical protein